MGKGISITHDRLSKFRTDLMSDDWDKKESIISALGDLYEYGEMDKNEVIEGINLLLSHVILEKDDVHRESIFHTIHNAVVYKDVAKNIALDMLLLFMAI